MSKECWFTIPNSLDAQYGSNDQLTTSALTQLKRNSFTNLKDFYLGNPIWKIFSTQYCTSWIFSFLNILLSISSNSNIFRNLEKISSPRKHFIVQFSQPHFNSSKLIRNSQTCNECLPDWPTPGDHSNLVSVCHHLPLIPTNAKIPRGFRNRRAYNNARTIMYIR